MSTLKRKEREGMKLKPEDVKEDEKEETKIVKEETDKKPEKQDKKEEEIAPTNQNDSKKPKTNLPDDPLEDFEIGASPFVTQTEASQQYCLPAGTLSVCTVVEERANPRNARWAKVKLYARSEIRQRAHKRYGGIEGLRAEREKRARQRYEKDARRMKDLFRWVWEAGGGVWVIAIPSL